MKSFCATAVVAAGLALSVAHIARAADTYPTRPIKVIVNTAPGGYTDLMARMAGQYMSEYLKQPVVVENRAGGDGMIAVRYVKSTPPDGYTLLVATGTAAQQMAMRQDPG